MPPARDAGLRAARCTTGRTCAGSARALGAEVLTARSITQSSSARISSRVGSCCAAAESSSNSHGLPSEPRASSTASRAGALERRARELSGRAGRRRSAPAPTAPAPAVPRARSPAGRCGAVEASRGWMHQPPRPRRARRVARATATPGGPLTAAPCAASQSPAGRSPARPRARPRQPIGVASSAAPAPVLQTFGTGQPMLMSIRSAPACRDALGRRAITSGSAPNSWTETGCSFGWIRNSSRQGALVAVVDARSSTPSPRPPARRRSAWPAAARTSCRSPPAAPARPGSDRDAT